MGIYKRQQIIQAYSGFPRLGIRDLLFGDIINWTPGRTVWWPAANWAEVVNDNYTFPLTTIILP